VKIGGWYTIQSNESYLELGRVERFTTVYVYYSLLTVEKRYHTWKYDPAAEHKWRKKTWDHYYKPADDTRVRSSIMWLFKSKKVTWGNE
jgi:hypothetical protein